MKTIKSLFKLYKRFDLWLHKDRNGPGELYDTTSYKGAVNLIMLGLIGATILLLLPEILNESNEAKKRWLNFWAIAIAMPPIIVGFISIVLMFIKRNLPQKHDELIRTIEDNQSKALEIYKQQTLSKSIEDEIGKIEVSKAIPTSLTIEKTDDTPHSPLAPKSTRPVDKDKQ